MMMMMMKDFEGEKIDKKFQRRATLSDYVQLSIMV